MHGDVLCVLSRAPHTKDLVLFTIKIGPSGIVVKKETWKARTASHVETFKAPKLEKLKI